MEKWQKEKNTVSSKSNKISKKIIQWENDKKKKPGEL